MEFIFNNRRNVLILTFALSLYFVSPFIAFPFICILMVFSSKCEGTVNVIFLTLFALYFILLFFSRSYGVNFSFDTYDDAPGYYVWFNEIRQYTMFDLFLDREMFYWLPLLVINYFYQINEAEFFFVNYALMFSLFFIFSYKMYGNKSLPFIYLFLFLTPASIYSFTHIFRQTFALLYFLFSIYFVSKSNLKWAVLFCVISVLCHNSFFIIVTSFFLSIFLCSSDFSNKNKFYGGMIFFVFIGFFMNSLPIMISQLGGDIDYKMEHYEFYDSFGTYVITKQSLFVFVIVLVVFPVLSNYTSKIIIISLLLTNLFGVYSGAIALIDRLSIATLPLLAVALFNEVVFSCKVKPMILNLALLFLISFSTCKTYFALMNGEHISRFWMKSNFIDCFYYPVIYLLGYLY